MKALIIEKQEAIKRRLRGGSIKEIARELGVAVGSVSLWVKDLKLSEDAKKRLLLKIKKGQYISAERKKAQVRAQEEFFLKEAMALVKRIDLNADLAKILCAAIYWCEGSKNPRYGINFMNSDPRLIKFFIYVLNRSFEIDFKKFKPFLHLHSYHDIKTEIDFWSKITKIKASQFSKPYIKANGGIKIRENYHGCLSLRYYDADKTRQLLAIGQKLFEMGA